MLNTELISRPLNWLIVATMVLIGAFALHLSLGLIHGTDILDLKHPSRAN